METKKSYQPSEFREILLRHEGSITEIARQLDVRPATVSQVLSGKGASSRIMEACKLKAKYLRAKEMRGAAKAEIGA